MKDVLNTCDETMSLLLGKVTSVGELRGVVKQIEEYGTVSVCFVQLPLSAASHSSLFFVDSGVHAWELLPGQSEQFCLVWLPRERNIIVFGHTSLIR